MYSLPLISSALLVLLSQFSFQGVEAIDLKSADEGPCVDMNNTVPVDMEWVKSRKTWYYPLMSRLDLYVTAVDLLGKEPKDIPEEYVYYDSCPMFDLEGKQLTANWFNGKVKTWNLKPIKGLEHFEVSDAGARGGTAYTVLTDNKTFSATAFCMTETNQMTWGVLSAVKALPMETMKQIYDHMESIGFQREQFTAIRYDHCKTE